jgi:hypothetical protein
MNKTTRQVVFGGFGAWIGWQFGSDIVCSLTGSPTSLCAGYNQLGQVSTPLAQPLAALAGAMLGYALGA